MLNKLKNLFNKSDAEAAPKSASASAASVAASSAPSSTLLPPAQIDAIREQVKDAGYEFQAKSDGSGFAVGGEVAGYEWRMERGAPMRDYINTTELRCKLDLELDPELQVMVLNRPLRRALDNNVFSQFTDTLQTVVNNRMPEEMLWLTMYPEVGWKTLDATFMEYFCIYAETSDVAQAWISDDITQTLLNRTNFNQHDPFVLMLLRGKVYLRCEYDDTPETLLGLIRTIETLGAQAHAQRDAMTQAYRAE